MTFIIDFGKDNGEGPFWNWRSGKFKSRVVTRYWWGPIAVSKLNIPHLEYTQTSFDWVEGKWQMNCADCGESTVGYECGYCGRGELCLDCSDGCAYNDEEDAQYDFDEEVE